MFAMFFFLPLSHLPFVLLPSLSLPRTRLLMNCFPPMSQGSVGKPPEGCTTLPQWQVLHICNMVDMVEACCGFGLMFSQIQCEFASSGLPYLWQR